MIISSINNQLSFQAKNKKIKEADKILRKTAQVYPMLSATYADIYYHNNKREIFYKINYLQEKVENSRTAYTKDFADKLSKLPDNLKNDSGMGFVCLIDSTLPALKKSKVGNCGEHATVAYTCLLANGYNDSQKMDLEYETTLVEKGTNRVFDRVSKSLDHSFVLTSMSKDKKDKNNIVVDYWLGFADSISGAIEKFKEAYTEEDLKSAEEENIKRIKQWWHKGSDENYEYRSRMVFKPSKVDMRLNVRNSTDAQEYIKRNFLDLII